MADDRDQLWHDLSIVVKHARFLVVLFVLALIVAVLAGFALNSDGEATSELRIDVEIPAASEDGTTAAPTVETFEYLAENDAIDQAAVELGLERAELEDKVTITSFKREPTDPQSPEDLRIEADGSSLSEARRNVRAVTDAFLNVAQGLSADPREVAALEEIVALARQEIESQDTSLEVELSDVQNDLNNQRRLKVTLEQNITSVDQALAIVDANASEPVASLIVAVTTVLGPQSGAGVASASSVAELRQGLVLARSLSEQVIAETQTKIDTLAAREQELVAATAPITSARLFESSALRGLEASSIAAQQTETIVTLTKDAEDTSGGAGLLARVGAAAAFSLVVGVTGAFAIEFVGPLWRRWRRREAPRQPDAA